MRDTATASSYVERVRGSTAASQTIIEKVLEELTKAEIPVDDIIKTAAAITSHIPKPAFEGYMFSFDPYENSPMHSSIRHQKNLFSYNRHALQHPDLYQFILTSIAQIAIHKHSSEGYNPEEYRYIKGERDVIFIGKNDFILHKRHKEQWQPLIPGLLKRAGLPQSQYPDLYLHNFYKDIDEGRKIYPTKIANHYIIHSYFHHVHKTYSFADSENTCTILLEKPEAVLLELSKHDHHFPHYKKLGTGTYKELQRIVMAREECSNILWRDKLQVVDYFTLLSKHSGASTIEETVKHSHAKKLFHAVEAVQFNQAKMMAL